MLGLRLMPSVQGLVVFLLPMLINIVYFIFPPQGKVEDAAKTHPMLELIEKASRVLYAVLICAFVSVQGVSYSGVWFVLGIGFLLLYYLVWIRYFAGGRQVGLLGKSFLFVPMPLAVFPVLYFLCAALWLRNYPAFAAMIIFGIAHNIISWQSFSDK